MSDKHLLAIIPIALISMLIVSSCNKPTETYMHLNTVYSSDTDTLQFYNYNAKGYYNLSGTRVVCDYSGNNVFVDTELVGTFINYYTFTMDNVNYFVTNFD